MTNSIFISYRRGTSSWVTRALHDVLCKHFGHEQVFMDVNDIDYGTDFATKIEQEVGRCSVVLGVIDPGWISITDENGNRRIDNPDDYVRLEIGMGLKRRVAVVPILVDGATNPKKSELPEDLKALSTQNAIELRHSHFEADCNVLVESLKKTLESKDFQGAVPNNEKANSRTELKVARLGLIGTLGAAVIAALVALIINWPFGENVEKKPGDISVTASEGSVAIGGNVNVGGDLAIHQDLDPAMLKFVEKAVDALTTQLDEKDSQLQGRDEQIHQLTEAVAALVREKGKPNAPPGLDQALAKLEQGDTEMAKAIFRQLVDTKYAQSANKEAATAARHLGALALLNDEKEARKAYQRATELDPENVEAKNQLNHLQKQPGEFRLQARLAEGGEPQTAWFHVYHAKQDLDGKRKRVTYSNPTTTAKFTLNAGRYFVEAVVEDARTSQEFDLQPGQLINQSLLLPQTSGTSK